MPSTPSTPSTTRALLAAADSVLRDTMRDALVAAGCVVTTADDVEGAMAAMREAPGRETPGIVAVDTVRDGTTIDLCRRIRAIAEDGTILLAVARETETESLAECLESLLDAGADDYLIVGDGLPAVAERAVARARVAAKRVDECAARRKAEGTLERTRRFLGIDETAGLQHEINNPLAALLAHASLLEQGIYEPGEEKELLGVIVEQARRIEQVVRRLSALRYPDGPEFVPDDAPDDVLHDDAHD